jgi:hypothetical protein
MHGTIYAKEFTMKTTAIGKKNHKGEKGARRKREKPLPFVVLGAP